MSSFSTVSPSLFLTFCVSFVVNRICQASLTSNRVTLIVLITLRWPMHGRSANREAHSLSKHASALAQSTTRTRKRRAELSSSHRGSANALPSAAHLSSAADLDQAVNIARISSQRALSLICFPNFHTRRFALARRKLDDVREHKEDYANCKQPQPHRRNCLHS